MRIMHYFCLLFVFLIAFPVQAEKPWVVSFHSLPFYEDNCSDADTICNNLSITNDSILDIPENMLFWKIEPFGDNSIDRNDFVFNEFPTGQCQITKNNNYCNITDGSPWIIMNDGHEGNEAFQLHLFDVSGNTIAIINDKNFQLTEQIKFIP